MIRIARCEKEINSIKYVGAYYDIDTEDGVLIDGNGNIEDYLSHPIIVIFKKLKETRRTSVLENIDALEFVGIIANESMTNVLVTTYNDHDARNREESTNYSDIMTHFVSVQNLNSIIKDITYIKIYVNQIVEENGKLSIKEGSLYINFIYKPVTINFSNT